jgi:1-phosphofructokinase
MAPAVTVFTPTPLLTISIERVPAGTDDIHLRAGGQGVWVARMLRSLGCAPLICGPFGGETGAVARMILANEGFDVRAVEVEGATPSFDVVESAGSGDSMTAALAAGIATDMDAEALLALAAAGAVNVTRHGLGGADPDVVRQMAQSVVTVTVVDRH